MKINDKAAVVSSIAHHFSKAKEDIIVAKRGNYQKMLTCVNFGRDVLLELRNRQSEKPAKIHEMIENNYRDGAKLGELFARNNNVRSHWISFGLELKDTWESDEVKRVKDDLMLAEV